MLDAHYPQRMIKPPALKRSQCVAIVSPSGKVDPCRVEGAVSALRQWGYSPVVGQHTLGEHRSWGAVITGGTDQQRLADLLWAISDPAVHAIWCSRGGYGAVRLLEYIDPQLVRSNPKWLVGFSDISALHALWHKAGVMSLHAPMAKHLAQFGAEGEVSEAIHAIVSGEAMPTYRIASHALNRQGEVSGTLLGGNLAVLSALVGTDYSLLRPGSVLFIEDVAEEIYRVERLFYQLRLSGVLPTLKALVVGQFTRYHLDGKLTDTASDTRQCLYRMIAHLVEPYGYPVAFDFPVGHTDTCLPLVEGAPVTLRVTASEVMLAQG